MNATRSILDLVTTFPWAIVLVLALGEAFKTVVEEGKFIHWDRLYSLGSFLLLILPFYQGMNRYLLVAYGDAATLPIPHAPFLVSAAFMVESALFFVLSRTLRSKEWQHFYWVVLVLLVTDSLWWSISPYSSAARITLLSGRVFVDNWTILNLVTSIFILVLVLLGPRLPYQPHLPAAIGTAAMLVRTIIDYWVSWSLFFPPPLRLNMP
jgi:hypothetical protein